MSALMQHRTILGCRHTRQRCLPAPHALHLQPAQQPQRWPAQLQPALCHKASIRGSSRLYATPGLGDEELDVAVFRFTLGIPGFDDSNIPRVVGAAVAALVAINHVLGADPAPPAQVRAEFLDILLAVLCFTAPEIEGRLRQVGPGKGRAGAGDVAGAAQLFALAEGQPEAVRKELAWTSFALLKNVNCCSVLLLQPEASSALMARGAVAQAVAVQGNTAASLAKISQAISSSSSSVLPAGQQQLWLPDRSALQQAGVSSWGFVPEGVQSALLQAVPGGKQLLLVLAERPRALSDKDRKWVAAVASKLGGVL
ncbi:hypothetical protein OEZ86_008037 [Tetradesmus obliquus]|nr:hypothetical protein OEZ86_008037 [Tetradesmus obliquus]